MNRHTKIASKKEAKKKALRGTEVSKSVENRSRKHDFLEGQMNSGPHATRIERRYHGK